MQTETRLVSSLVKVMPTPRLTVSELSHLSAVRGEVVSFQLAARCDRKLLADVTLRSDLPKECFAIRRVGLVPCLMPANREDEYAFATEPGVFPDPLLPLDGPWFGSPDLWNALWITCRVPADAPAGVHKITLTLSPAPGFARHREEFEPIVHTLELEIIPAQLPRQTLTCLNWFHADCIASVYRVAPWSGEHWSLLAAYFGNMSEHGCNSLLTPLWSISLDVREGGERPTCQLLDITFRDGEYSFDFTRLERWIDLARRCGLEYFEMVHPFTQWGAKATPKIMVEENGTLVKKFGWHVPSDSPEYAAFLGALYPRLQEFLIGKGLRHKCFFHVSDEPNMDCIGDYRKTSALIRGLVNEEDFTVIDALSNTEFVKTGLIGTPIPSVQHIDPFMELELPHRWTYYCCGGTGGVPNRFLGISSLRNRVLGVLLYLYRIEGFLQWGFNFWYSQLSLQMPIDPYSNTDAGGNFPGGDAFQVYPGPAGPVDSLHYEVFREALQDQRALQLLESRIGRDAVVALIHEGVDYELKMSRYPREDWWLLDLRARVNAKLKECFA